MQQVGISLSPLALYAIVMGTGAWSTGWGWDFQLAKIEFRQAGWICSTGMMGVCHYAAMPYPAKVPR